MGAGSQALEAWSRALAPLEAAAPPSGAQALELLRPDRSPVPFQGMDLELGQLADWLTGDIPGYVLSGPAGAGKTRLALEAARRARGWATGWLRLGAGASVCAAVRERGEPTLILVDDADLRPDLLPLLDHVREHRLASRAAAVRVLLVARSEQDLLRRLRAAAGGRPPGHAELQDWAGRWLSGAPRSADQVFRDAVSAFAAVIGVQTDDTPGPDRGEAEPVGVIVARALLLVLDQARGDTYLGPPDSDPRAITQARLAARLISHEQDRWAAATEWDWGGREPPSRALQARVLAALTLLGADSADTAADVLELVPMPRDAPAGLRAAIASWTASLYPPAAQIGMSPHLAAGWFVVRQLAGSPLLARRLRAELTPEQRTRALGLLSRAVGHVRGADRLFAELAGVSADSLAIAIGQSVTANARRRHDALLADLVRRRGGPAPGGWEPAQLARFRATATRALPHTLAALDEARAARYRALAATSAVYWLGLADALTQLGASLAAAGRSREARAAEQAVDALRRGLGDTAAVFPKELRYLLSPLNEHDARLILHLSYPAGRPVRGEYRELMLWLAHMLLLSARPGSAVAAAQEAVAAEREFTAAAREPVSAPWGGLATSLAVLGDALAGAGRYSEAVWATRAATSYWMPEDGPVRSLSDTGYPEALLALSTRLGQAAQADEARAARDRALRVIAASLARGGTYQDRSPGLLGHLVRSHEADRPAWLLAELAYEALTIVHAEPDTRSAGRKGATLAGRRLDVGVLLAEFAAFWRQHGGVPGKDRRYPGAAPDQVFTALLERLADGIGTVDERYQLRERGQQGGPRRWTEIRICTRYMHPAGTPVEQHTAIQLAEREARSWRPRGLSASSFLGPMRMDEFLDRQGLRTGALVIFDRRPRPVRARPHPRLSRVRTQGGREIVVLTC